MRPRPYLLLLAILFFGASLTRAADAPVPENPEHPAPKRPVRIKFEGMITTFTHEYMKRQLQRAKEYGADFIIIDINSPGGDAQASIDIAHDLSKVENAKTVAYVERLAMSGAAFVALGCDDIVLEPEAKIGDAGPIVLGEDSLFRHAPEKIVSFLVAEVRSVARVQNHPPALAEAMIDKDVAVHFYKNKTTGETRCLTEAEVKDQKDPDEWEKGKLVFGSGGGRFLTMPGNLALETGLASHLVKSFEEFKTHYQITEEPPVYSYTWVDSVVDVLNFPLVTGLLLVLGLVFLFVELYIPGIGIFGILSGLCFVIFFWSRFLGGTADWLEVVLFVAGILCVAVELFLIPGLGVFGVSGVLLMLAGLTMAIAPAFGNLTSSIDSLANSATTVAGAVSAFAIVGVILSRYLGALPLFKRMMLAPPGAEAASENAADPQEDATTFADLLNQEGITRTSLRPAGKARIGEHDVDVLAEGAFIAPGTPIRVILVQGNRVIVRAASSD